MASIYGMHQAYERMQLKARAYRRSMQRAAEARDQVDQDKRPVGEHVVEYAAAVKVFRADLKRAARLPGLLPLKL